MINMGTKGTDKAAKETKIIADHMKDAQDRAAAYEKIMGRTGASAAKRSGAFNDRDGVSTRENRGSKGVSGQRGAAGRDFAGLRDASDSTSGIVAAYATAAANMFAITAAFKALADAAKVQQLKEGLELVGAQSGVTLSIVSKNLEKVTGYGISAAEAMKSVASATAAGFSGKEIERLGGVARGAAVALGRDLSDAMDRLTRGSIKLEPELLDELGIMTRIDDAVTIYANAHNKAKSSLTQTERRQAFLNAVLEEGEAKFSSISESVPISAYDKLTAAMKNMSTAGIGALVKTLEPLIDLLTTFPQLIMVPLAGVMQSVVGKLIPSADKMFTDLTGKAKAFGVAMKNTQKFANFRMEDISETTYQARSRAQGKMGIKVDWESEKLPQLQKENALVQQQLALDKEILKTAVATNVAGSEAIRIAQRKVEAGIATAAAYKQAIALTQKDAALAPAVAKRTLNFDYASAAASQFSATQFKLGEKEGDTVGRAATYWKGMGAQIKEANVAIRSYKNDIAASNAQLGTSSKLMTFLEMQWVKLGIRVQMFGVMGRIAMTAISEAIPIIGLLIVGWTMLTAAMDFFKSEKQKALEEYGKKLEEVLKTAFKVTEEIAKFREKGQYGQAFQAEITNAKELLATLRELQEIKDKKEGDFGIKNKAVQKGVVDSGLEDKEKQALGFLLSRLETFKSPAEFKKLSETVLATAKAGGDFSALLEKDVANIAVIEKSWSGITESAKKGGDAVRKFYGGEAFKTGYTDISDQLREIGLEISNQQKTIFDPVQRRNAMQTTAENMMKGGREYFLEMDRLMGNSSTKFTQYFDYIAFYQQELSKTAGKTDAKSIRSAAYARQQITEATNGLTKAYVENTIAAKGEIENLKVKEQEFTASVAKAQLQLQEVRNAIRTTDNEIKKTLAAVARSKSSNGTDLGQTPGLIDAIKSAEVALQNAKDVQSFKEASIRADYALLDAQKEFEYFKMKSANDREIAEYNKIMNAAPATGLNYSETQWGSRAVAVAEAERMTAQRKLLVLLQGGLGAGAALVEEQVRQLRQAGKQAEANVLQAKEALRVYVEGEGRRHDLVLATLASERKILDLKLKATANSLELEKLRATNAAAGARGNFGGQVTTDVSLGWDKTGIQNNIKEQELNEAQRIAEYNESRLNLQNIIDGFNKQMVGLVVGTDAYKGFEADRAKSVAALSSLDEIEIGLKDQNATALEILAARLFGVVKDIERLDLDAAIKNRFTVAKDKQTLANASIGSNMIGSGAEFQEGIAQELKDNSRWGGDIAKLLADPSTVKRIKESSAALAELNIVAEGTQAISAAFHSELAGAFSAIIDGSKDAGEAFGDMALSMLKMIGELISQLIAMQLIKSMAGIPGLGFLGAGAAGGIMPMATGGIMSRSAGPLQGVIDRPTYLVGEGRYNEAVVPLPNGRAIPVQMHGNNTSSNSVQVNINMTQTGETKTDSKGPDMNNLGAAVAAAVQKELQAQKAPGGILSRYGVA